MSGRYIYLIIGLTLAACSKHSTINKMEEIKAVGDNNPTAAIAMLNSLKEQIKGESKYEQRKYDLLRIRLNDKAEILPNSDNNIKELVEYFQNNGSIAEKQEVYYYAGSVYRDLRDTPRALGFFLKSLETANNRKECDSIMLRNTYSNLTYLYYRVQNYKDALNTAQKELEICKKMKKDQINAYTHIGSAYLALDSISQARETLDIVYNLVINSSNKTEHQEALVLLLNHYSQLDDIEKAAECCNLLNKEKAESVSYFANLALAQYYDAAGKQDSAAILCKKILEENKNLFDMHDAAKMLYKIYLNKNDMHQAYQYAQKYIELKDSLDLGKRQELAATVNNEYKYHQDQKKEQELKEQNNRYKNWAIMAFLLTAVVVSIGFIIYYRKRNKHLQEIIELSSKLEQKIEQNKEVIKMLHQAKLEEKAESVIENIRQSAIGQKSMTTDDWKQLYQAVDELYPEFKERMLKELGSFTEQQMQVCYLMRIGIAKPQIQNITNLSRVTVWRWVKKFEWALNTEQEA